VDSEERKIGHLLFGVVQKSFPLEYTATFNCASYPLYYRKKVSVARGKMGLVIATGF
jgi:hypothetical protein